METKVKKRIAILAALLLLLSFAVAEGIVSNAFAQNTLIGYWSFDEGAGTLAHDLSGNNNDGTIHGASWTTGKVGQALEFNGFDEYVGIHGLFSSSPSSLTISLWMNSRMNSIDQGTLFIHQPIAQFGVSSPYRYENGDVDSAVVAFGVKLTDEVWYNAISDPIAPDVWHNVVGVWVRGESAKLYVDGTLAASVAIPDLFLYSPSDYRFYSGMGVWNNDVVGPDYWYEGALDEVILYDYARTPEQIAQYYASPVPPTASPTQTSSSAPTPSPSPTPTGIVSFWKCEDGTGTTFADSVGNNDGVITGAVFASGPNVGLGTALQFDGSAYVTVVDNPTIKPQFITAEAWIFMDQLPPNLGNPTPTEGVYDIVSKWRRNPDYGYELHVLQDHLRFTVGADGWVWAEGATSIKAGQWYHVAGTYDGNTVIVYLNGVQDGLTTKPAGRTFANSDTPLEIGGHHELGGALERSFKGKIDEIALYNEALSSDEIASHYANGVQGIDYIGGATPTLSPSPIPSSTPSSPTATTGTSVSPSSSNFFSASTYPWTEPPSPSPPQISGAFEGLMPILIGAVAAGVSVSAVALVIHKTKPKSGSRVPPPPPPRPAVGSQPPIMPYKPRVVKEDKPFGEPKYCLLCGAENQPNANNCSSCGRKIE